MSADVEDQLNEKVKKSEWFAIQIDESTDAANKAILLCHVRYIDYDCSDLKEEFLCCSEIPARTTSSEIFRLLDEYLKNHSLDWKSCIGLCTDGAANMTGRLSGVKTRIQAVAGDGFIFTHCVIHREHLAAKKMSPSLHEVLSVSIQIVNFIKSNALNSRMFTMLCEEMDSGHSQLLLHAEVRWLSRGRVLTRLYELRDEVKIFLNQKNSNLAKYLADEEWVAKLAYLSDIFSLINQLNLSLQ